MAYCTLINAGLSFDKVSFVVSGLGFSSLLINVVVPFLPGTDTETISWSKCPINDIVISVYLGFKQCNY